MIRSTGPTSADADSHIFLYQNMKIYRIYLYCWTCFRLSVMSERRWADTDSAEGKKAPSFPP